MQRLQQFIYSDTISGTFSSLYTLTSVIFLHSFHSRRKRHTVNHCKKHTRFRLTSLNFPPIETFCFAITFSFTSTVLQCAFCLLAQWCPIRPPGWAEQTSRCPEAPQDSVPAAGSCVAVGNRHMWTHVHTMNPLCAYITLFGLLVNRRVLLVAYEGFPTDNYLTVHDMFSLSAKGARGSIR